jgi:AraC family transcriptional regulator
MFHLIAWTTTTNVTTKAKSDNTPLLPHQLARLHRAHAFMEDRLGDGLTLSQIARSAAFSPYHFHRLFGRLTGESVQSNLLRTRLERAAFELVYSDRSILEIALANGYNSPASFTRAFDRRFKAGPRRFRRERPLLKNALSIPRELRNQFAELKPECRFEERRVLVCIRRQGLFLEAAGEAWNRVQRCIGSHTKGGLPDVFELTPDFPYITPSPQMRFDVGVATECSGGRLDESFERVIPGGRYAVFHFPGTRAAKVEVNHLWNYLYVDWLPGSGMRVRSSGSYEVYRNSSNGSPRVELHVPLETARI